jgi:hypothetical protein
MVAIQLGTNAAEAVDRLRAYAYACGRPISSVAADIITHRLNCLVRVSADAAQEDLPPPSYERIHGVIDTHFADTSHPIQR